MTTTTGQVKITSAEYTHSSGHTFIIVLDRKLDDARGGAWKYFATFAGLKCIANERSVDDLIEELEKQTSYLSRVQNLIDAGYKYNDGGEWND